MACQSRRRLPTVQPPTSFRRVAIVMAGGAGERFWPLSRRHRPKQLLRLTNNRESMLEEAISRLSPLIPPEHIYIVTGEHLLEAIREARVGVPDENVIAEPLKRNTSGCLAYATAHLLMKYGPKPARGKKRSPAAANAALDVTIPEDLSVAVVPADPMIGDADAFRKTVTTVLDAAERHRALAMIGIAPTRAETGYGYLESARQRPVNRSRKIHVYPVARFHEKPSRDKAEAYLTSGRCLWNSGMFFWSVAAFMAELEVARPALAGAILAMTEALRRNDTARVRKIFEALEDISIDKALMERARNVLVARAEFPWDDVGAWPALDRIRPRDPDGNVLAGDPIAVDCRNCIIYVDAPTGGREIAAAVVGADNLIVVVSDDAVLVAPKDRAQDVRRVLDELKRRNARQV